MIPSYKMSYLITSQYQLYVMIIREYYNRFEYFHFTNFDVFEIEGREVTQTLNCSVERITKLNTDFPVHLFFISFIFFDRHYYFPLLVRQNEHIFNHLIQQKWSIVGSSILLLRYALCLVS